MQRETRNLFKFAPSSSLRVFQVLQLELGLRYLRSFLDLLPLNYLPLTLFYDFFFWTNACM